RLLMPKLQPKQPVPWLGSVPAPGASKVMMRAFACGATTTSAIVSTTNNIAVARHFTVADRMLLSSRALVAWSEHEAFSFSLQTGLGIADAMGASRVSTRM